MISLAASLERVKSQRNRRREEERGVRQRKECAKIGISFSAYGICINFHLGANERQTSQVKTGKLQNNEQGEQGKQGKQSALQAYHNNGERRMTPGCVRVESVK